MVFITSSVEALERLYFVYGISWVMSLFIYLFIFLITKTRLFKYIENFTSKNGKFSEKKNSLVGLNSILFDNITVI